MRNNRKSRNDRPKKEVRPYNFLIVTEGTRTEPNYFNGLKQCIHENYANSLELKHLPKLDIKGKGMNTTSLIEYTSKFVNYSTKQYGQVWIIFDKDNFTDEQFNSAALSSSFNIGWSNPNFELWLLLHFEKVTSKITADQIITKLNSHFKNNGLKPYSKNDVNIFNNVTKNGDLSLAIKYSEDLIKLNTSNSPANSSPCTSVYLLLNELMQFIDK